MRFFRCIVGAALAVAGFSVCPAAHAQQDKVAAEALFDQGKQLLEDGKAEEACPKFAESLRLDSGIGTMLYLADCWERVGRTASAWAQFREAAAEAARKGDDREGVARERASALQGKLSKLTISVAPDAAGTAGLEVKRGDNDVNKALWGTPVPVDPGDVVISASAPGKATWTRTVQVPPGPSTINVDVPALADDAGGGGAVPPGDDTATDPTLDAGFDTNNMSSGGWSTQRTVGAVIAGAGVVGLGVGTYFGLRAKSKNDESEDYCLPDNRCSRKGEGLRDTAQGAATVSTISFGVGIAALIGGSVLYLTAPKKESVAIAPDVGPGRGGVWMTGRF